MPPRTHYEVLGVRPDASRDDIRRAYRDLARRLHPDVGVAAERHMGEINDAWHVLGDHDRRRAYDATLRDRAAGSSRARPAGHAATGIDSDGDDDLVPAGSGPRGVWWVVLVAVLGAIFVVTAYAGGRRDAPPEEPPAKANVGRCVAVRPGPTTTVVACSAQGALRIVSRITEGERCPAGTEVRRLATDGRLECVERAR